MQRWNGTTWVEVPHDHNAQYIGVAIGGQTITNPTLGNVVLTVKGAAGQTAALLRAQTSVPDDVLTVAADGAITSKVTSTTAFNIQALAGTNYVVVNTSAPNFQLRNGMNLNIYSDNGTTGKWSCIGSTGATSQTGNLAVTAGGANITGTVAVTGGITATTSVQVVITGGNAYVGPWVSDASYARFGHSAAATGNYGYMQHSSGAVYVSGATVQMRINNGSDRLIISAAGASTMYAASLGYVDVGTGAATLYAGSYFQCVNAGTAVVQSTYTGNPYLQAGSTNFCYHPYNATNTTWDYAPLVAYGSGRSAITLHNGTSAPQLQSDNGGGNRIYCKTSDGATFTDIMASAFPVSSAARFKDNILEVSDDELLRRVASTPPLITFEKKPEARTQTITLDERFEGLNRRWLASGKKHALRPEGKHFRSERHDCSKHSCGGTAESPCGIIINEEPDVGFLAEEMAEVWPETVYVTPEGEVEAIDYSKLAAVALRANAVLLRRLQELERRVDELSTHQG